jgi:hypothetical protein
MHVLGGTAVHHAPARCALDSVEEVLDNLVERQAVHHDHAVCVHERETRLHASSVLTQSDELPQIPGRSVGWSGVRVSRGEHHAIRPRA